MTSALPFASYQQPRSRVSRQYEASRPNFLVSLLYILVIAGYPFTAMIRVYFGYEADDVTVSYILRAAIMGLSVFVFFAFSRKRRWASHFGWRVALVVFWALYLFRIFYDQFSQAGIETVAASLANMNYLLYAVCVTFIPMAGFLIVPTLRELRLAAIGSIFMLSMVCAGVLMIPESADFVQETGRVGLQTLNPISLGHCGTTLVILCGVFAVSRSRGSRDWARMLVSVVLMLPGLYTTWIAGSRGPVMALLVTGLIYLGWVFRSLHWKILVVILTAGSFVLTAAVLLATRGGTFTDAAKLSIVDRTETEFDGLDSYARAIILRSGISDFTESPLFGSGIVDSVYGEYPHNLFVEAFMATGVFGGILFAGLVLSGLAVVWRTLQVGADEIWVPLLFVQFLISGLFSGAIWGSNLFWAFAVATISVGNSFLTARGSGATTFYMARSLIASAPLRNPGLVTAPESRLQTQ